MRGGERVLEAIASALAPEHDIVALYTMFDDGRPLSPHLDSILKRVSWLGRVPGAKRMRRWMLPGYPMAVGGLSRRLARDHARAPIDLLISTSSAAVKGLRTPLGVPHLCYCHTPARYLWSQSDEYSGGLRGLGLRLFGGVLRRWDRRTAENVSEFLANSTHTASEIRRCYGRDARVLFPPARTGWFTPSDTPHACAGTPCLSQPGDEDPGARSPRLDPRLTTGSGRVSGHELEERAWLAVGALEAYKRFDLAIQAANAAGHPLMIVGGGSDERRLRRMAGPTVSFVGRVDDERLRSLYRSARLLLFPQIEDFGIVAVEAQACGCPVVARRAGGAIDTVVDGVTGVFFEGATVGAIMEAVARTPARTPEVERACRANAERFSEVVFAAGVREAVGRMVMRARVN